jgi:hypothetical protein
MPSLIFSVVLVVFISYNKLQPFIFAQGKATFINQNIKRLKNTETVKIGRIMRKMEIPALFKAVNSKFSPNFPKVIKEDNNTDKGIASGIVIREK